MKGPLILGVGVVAVSGIFWLVASDFSDPLHKGSSVVKGTETLRAKQIETSRIKQLATSQTPQVPADFRNGQRDPTQQQSIRFDGNRAVVPNALPPKLSQLKNQLDVINREIEQAIAVTSPAEASALRGDALVAKTNAMIAATSKQLNIDTTEVNQRLSEPRVATTPEQIALNNRIDSLDAELTDWSRKRAQQSIDNQK